MQKERWNINLKKVMPVDLRIDVKNSPAFYRALTYLICKRSKQNITNYLYLPGFSNDNVEDYDGF